MRSVLIELRLIIRDPGLCRLGHCVIGDIQDRVNSLGSGWPCCLIVVSNFWGVRYPYLLVKQQGKTMLADVELIGA